MRLLLMMALAMSGCLAGPGDRAVGALSEAATVCAPGATVTGIDVSHYQGTVDWAKVAASGRKFGIVKATEGTGYTDASFAGNWAAMPKAGVLRAAYHFFHANLDPVQQAQHFVNVMGALGAGDLPPMLDLEVTDGQSAATVASTAKTWLTTVEQLTGKKPIVYTYPDFWQNRIGAPSGFTGYPLNIANYGVTCPNVVGAWATWTMWQNSSTGTVPGVSGQCDEDVFNGDLNALQGLGGGTGMTDPCAGLVDGSYCGGDGLSGDHDTLYVCAGGSAATTTVCAAGCQYNPPGTPDACNPVPPAPDGGPSGDGDGGATGGGGGGGGGGGSDGADAGGGGIGGGGAGAMGSTASGCSAAGHSLPGANGLWFIALLLLGCGAVRFTHGMRVR